MINEVICTEILIWCIRASLHPGYAGYVAQTADHQFRSLGGAERNPGF